MSQSDTVTKALQNLSAIKEGSDPRTTETQEPSVKDAPSYEDSPLTVAENEVSRLYEEHGLSDIIPRDKVHVGVAQWNRRNGVCKYHRKLNGQKHFGKRMSSLPRATGHHVIAINEAIKEVDEFIETVRHELAHVIAYEKHGESQKHNHNWKSVATWLGAEPKACGSVKKDNDGNKYYIGCPGCGIKAGRKKLSKVIKQPFNRKCSTCGEKELVSFEAGDEMPEENGTVAVSRVPWDNKSEWIEWEFKE